MSLTARDVEELLQQKLVSQKGYVAEVETAPGDVPEEWALFGRVTAVALSSGSFEVRFVEGPGFVAAKRDGHAIANEIVWSVWNANSDLANTPFEIHVDPANEFPDEWIGIIEEEAEKFIVEKNGYAGLVGGSDAETDGIVDGAVATLTGDTAIEIAFFPGPGYDRLAAGERASELFIKVVGRVKERLPQLEDWTFDLVWGE